jgi:hypothetical protein
VTLNTLIDWRFLQLNHPRTPTTIKILPVRSIQTCRGHSENKNVKVKLWNFSFRIIRERGKPKLRPLKQNTNREFWSEIFRRVDCVSKVPGWENIIPLRSLSHHREPVINLLNPFALWNLVSLWVGLLSSWIKKWEKREKNKI